MVLEKECDGSFFQVQLNWTLLTDSAPPISKANGGCRSDPDGVAVEQPFDPNKCRPEAAGGYWLKLC
jgi:hypothetical protein